MTQKKKPTKVQRERRRGHDADVFNNGFSMGYSMGYQEGYKQHEKVALVVQPQRECNETVNFGC